MSTMRLDIKHEMRALLAAAGKTLLDCPVSGTGAQAASKDLVVFASGDRAAYHILLAVYELPNGDHTS